MNNYLRKSAWLLVLLAFVSCKDDSDNRLQERPELQGLWGSGAAASASNSFGGMLDPKEYLGFSYDLTRSPSTTPDGICSREVIDLKQEPWSPFGLELTSIKPEVKVLKPFPASRFAKRHQVFSEMLADKDSVILHLAGDRLVKIPILPRSILEYSERANYARSIVQHIQKVVYYDNFTTEVLSSYLKPSFVEALKKSDAEELVSSFGTHLIGRYNVGGLLDFELLSDPYIFTEEETREMEKWIWEGGRKRYDFSILERIKERVLTYNYRQVGSKYFLRTAEHIWFATFGEMFEKGEQLSIAEWEKKLLDEVNAFVSLDEKQEGLIAIPDLIGDIPLKVKYTAGILHRSLRNMTLGKSSELTYYLAEPESFDLIDLDGKPLTLVLNSYRDTQSFLYLGDSKMGRMLKSSMLDGLNFSADQALKWALELQENGLWVIKSVASRGKLYLCRDMKVRTKEEDRNALRFWSLNPLVPKDDGELIYDVDRRLIQ